MGGIRSLKKENDNLPHPTFFYKDNFEDDFIRETEFFYRAESEKFIREHSFTEYMAKSEARFEEEKFRVSKYLHPQTERPLIKCCEDILITAHIERFYQEYAVLLRDHKVDGELILLNNDNWWKRWNIILQSTEYTKWPILENSI